MSKKKPLLALIDGNALIHRAFHALPPLTSPDGQLVNAVFGFTRILFKALKDLKPTHVAVAFDKKGPTFRHKKYQEYKATRVKAPDELYQQIPLVKKVVAALNIPSFEEKGYEADDLIGTLSKTIDYDNIIVTGDLDALQLVDSDTKVYTLRQGVTDIVTYDVKAVEERYGLKPDQLIDYKALVGDKSDNIPGVAGIGDKTAQKLLQDFGTLNNLYQAVDKNTPAAQKISPAVRQKLIADKKAAFMSQELGTIITDIPLKLKLSDFELADYDRHQVVDLFQKLGFKSLLKDLPAEKKPSPQASLFDQIPAEPFNFVQEVKKNKVEYSHPKSRKDLAKIISGALKAKKIALTVAASTPRPMDNDLLGLALSWAPRKAVFIPSQFIEDPALREILSQPQIRKVGFNLKDDLISLWLAGFKPQALDFDLNLAAYVLNPGRQPSDLAELVFAETSAEIMTSENLLGTGRQKVKITEVDASKLAFYFCQQADYIFRLEKPLGKKLASQKSLRKLFSEVEMPLVKVLAIMEKNGILLDLEVVKKISTTLDRQIKKLHQSIYDLAGTTDFNIDSPKQLSVILFEKLKINPADVKKTTLGFSTAAGEMAKIRHLHPLIPLIEKNRELTKLKNTYVDTLPCLVNKKTGRLHTSFNQAVTATGRLSSSDPNLQNIPIRAKIGREIRQAFIADQGYALLAADYSQIDLRVVADISKDSRMIRAFEKNEDIHTATAALVFGAKPAEVNKDQRRVAKTINFGVLYGMSPYGLSQTLGITREEAAAYIFRYFAKYPQIRTYTEKTLEFAKKNGYVKTLLGRRRYLPELRQKNIPFPVRSGAERMAINHPIQGTSSDIIKMAMNDIFDRLGDTPACHLLLQVHDELVFEVKLGAINQLAPKIQDIMEKAYQLSVPLKVKLETGPNWGDLKPLK